MHRPRVFFGWWVALAFALLVFISTGMRFTVGPFLKPVVADLGLDRASFSLVVALGLFLYGAFQPFVGRLVERVGARPVTFLGVLVLGGAMAATGTATRLWHLYVLYGVVMAAGLAATGHVVGSAVLARWFLRRRATALALIAGASMAGMSLLIPLATWLVLTVGWRATFGLFGLGMLLLGIPLTLFVVRESPESMGLTPDGLPVAPARVGAVVAERTAVSAAVQTGSFWQLSGGLATCGFSMTLISAHGLPMLTDHGYDPMLASWALALLGGTSIGFTLILGLIADRIGSRPVLAWLYGGRAVILLGLFLIRDQPVTLLTLAALGGATMGGTLTMTAALSANIFGRFSVGSVFGSIFVVHQTGSALGSWVGGALFELTGGYGAAFACAIVILVAGSVATLMVDERPHAAPRLLPVAGGR